MSVATATTESPTGNADSSYSGWARSLDYNAPPGASLQETDRELRQLERILTANRAVQTYSRRTGLQLGGGVTEVNQGDFSSGSNPSQGRRSRL